MYNFTDNNKLKTKLHYEYSEFGGYDFIQSYFDNRGNAINKLSIISKNKKLDISEIVTKPITKKISVKLLETSSFLINSLFYQLQQPQNFDLELFNIILRKFEVTKRIYTLYELPRVLKGGDYFDITNYCYFSMNCMQYYKSSKNLKYLNAGIKVNDILVSIIKEIDSKNDASLIWICLVSELDYIKELCKQNKVNISG